MACWDYIKPVQANASVFGPYGYGRRQLGNVSLSTLDTFSGFATRTRFTFITRGAVAEEVVYKVRSLDASSDGGGKGLSDERNYYGGDVGGTDQSNTYLPPNRTGAERSIFHQAAWMVSGYSGHWYVFVKSIQAGKTSRGWEFYPAAHTMEREPAGGGYAVGPSS